MTAANWTLEQVLSQLNSGSAWAGSEITYSFPTIKSGLYTGGGEGKGFEALTDVQITYAEYALTGWDDLIAASLVEVASNSNIEFGNTTTGIDYAHAYYPNLGSVWFNPTYDDVYNPVIGEYGFETFIHELGHALGLNHMGDYNGSDNSGPSSYQDSTVLSVMSYYGPDHYDGEGVVAWADWTRGGTTYSAQTPMLNDVMAIQAIYGADTTTRTGDTVYGFNSNITGSSALIFDFSINKNPILTIYDSSGNDTIDLSGYSTGSVISLVSGTFSHCNGMTYNIAIAYTATIENAVGGSGNDEISGNDVANALSGKGGNDILNGAGGNDILTGAAGDDSLDGGAGLDTANFSGAFANYTIRHNEDGSYTVTDTVGSDGQDTLFNVERLVFRDKTYSTDNGMPFVAHEIANQQALADAGFSFTVAADSFSDPEGATLTYAATLADGSDLPGWLTFDAETRTFSGTPAASDVGTLSVAVMASDGSTSASDIFEVNITNPDQSPVAFDDYASMLESQTVLVDVLANDTDPNGDDLTLIHVSVSGGEGTAVIENGRVRFDYTGADLAAGDSKDITVDYLVTDGTNQGSGQLHVTIGGEAGVIKGTAKNDTLSGTTASDMIQGLAGQDKIHAKAGADIIDGGKGRDLLWGEAGADIFTFGNKNGRDDIQDFSFQQGDRIDLSKVTAITGFNDLVKHHLYDSGGNAYIQISGKDDIMIWNVDPNDLVKSDFVF